MSQQTVLDLLKELDRPSSVDDIFDLAKRTNVKKALDRVKIRDSLILLSRKGIVKEANGLWTITHDAYTK